jgi:pimeloyl-ACP methyl ester carboxylesterase
MRFELLDGDATLVGDELGNGPALVLLHAGAERRTVWDPVVEILVAGGYSCVTLDQRGHGESSGSRQASFELFVRDVERLRHRLGRPAIYVGSSLGGLATLGMSARAGERDASSIRGVVLVDVVPQLDAERVRVGLTAALGADLAQSSIVRDILGRTDELCDAARALTVPTLLVRAERSFGLTREAGERFRQLVPHAEEVVIQDSGHLVARDQPRALAEALLAFASQLALAPQPLAVAVASVLDRAERWLELRARDVPHLAGTLLEHLRRTALWLERWSAPAHVRVAGLCHAAYGTDGFDTALTSDREELTARIGARAEQLIYDYCACDRSHLYAQLGASSLTLRDRWNGAERSLSAEDLTDFALLTLANELDVALHEPPDSALAGAIGGLIRRLEPYCPTQSAHAFRRLNARR